MEKDARTGSGPGANHTGSEIPHLDTIDPFIDRIRAVLVWTTLSTGITGVIGNILILLVYIKSGFSETIHFSYVALAVSDICCILSTMWMSFCNTFAIQAFFDRHRVKVDRQPFVIFTGGWPHLAFSRTTAFITAWISLERCLCVLLPTRVRLIITRTVTKIVLTTSFVLGCFPAVLAYVGLKTEWIFDPAKNMTELVMYEDLDEDQYIRFATILYSVIYPMLSWMTVSACTIFLIAKLRRSAKWRSSNATSPRVPHGGPRKKRDAYNRRENRVTKTVVMIACVFVGSSLPTSVHMIFSIAMREKYSRNAAFRDLRMLIATISLLFGEINSSANIIVYAITGAKFRSVLARMFSKKCNEN